MGAAKMKASSDKMMHVVSIDVDGQVDEIVAKSLADAERIAQSIIDAAMQLSTVQVPVGDWTSRGVQIIGTVVFDLAKARRTAVRIDSRGMQTASMGIKK
jgi:hypothetical protein